MNPLLISISIILPFIFLMDSTVSAKTPDSIIWDPFNSENKDIGLIMGMHQFKNTFIELGASMTKFNSNGCAWGTYFYGTSLSAEYNPFQHLGGISISYWTILPPFFTYGANINSYTNFDN